MHWLTLITGPAHAVYFGTYEIVKEAAGGNAEDGKHHPGAAGMPYSSRRIVELVLTPIQLSVVHARP